MIKTGARGKEISGTGNLFLGGTGLINYLLTYLLTYLLINSHNRFILHNHNKDVIFLQVGSLHLQ